MATQCGANWLAISNFVLSIVIGGVAGYIAWRQWKTARNKLNLDLFEKRLPIFEAAMSYVVSVLNNGKIVGDKGGEFLRASRSARWLFDNELADFLEKELYNLTIDLDVQTKELAGAVLPDERKAAVAKWRETKELLSRRMKDFEERASRFLQLRSD